MEASCRQPREYKYFITDSIFILREILENFLRAFMQNFSNIKHIGGLVKQHSKKFRLFRKMSQQSHKGETTFFLQRNGSKGNVVKVFLPDSPATKKIAKSFHSCELYWILPDKIYFSSINFVYNISSSPLFMLIKCHFLVEGRNLYYVLNVYGSRRLKKRKTLLIGLEGNAKFLMGNWWSSGEGRRGK